MCKIWVGVVNKWGCAENWIAGFGLARNKYYPISTLQNVLVMYVLYHPETPAGIQAIFRLCFRNRKFEIVQNRRCSLCLASDSDEQHR